MAVPLRLATADTGRPALPEPDEAAREHSGRVTAAVVEAIRAAGGWIALAEYLEIALYAPGLGYYAAGARKLGAAGDFTTAPEMTPLYGAALATQIGAILAAGDGGGIVELGAGSGRLAVDVVRELERLGVAWKRYAIVEPSPDLRERQRELVARELSATAAAKFEWPDGPPSRIDGAIVMNEVLDAIPPHVVARRGGAWFERGVVVGGDGAFTLDERPLADARLEALARARFPEVIDYASEVNPAAEALVEDLGRRLASGAMLIVDYGFPRAEFYHPQRSQGTLMAHYRHRATADPFIWPGLADLTAHVDFTAVAEAGERAGLAVAGYATQAAFLIGCGLLDRLAAIGEPTSAAYLREAGAVQRLLSPAEMGELFKVIALERGASAAWPGFARGDASHRL
ncbi:MAG: SAM-dependent methyltransferase [Burkholderiales bacterium]